MQEAPATLKMEDVDFAEEPHSNGLNDRVDNGTNDANGLTQETEDGPPGKNGKENADFKEIDWDAQAEQDDEDIKQMLMFAGDRTTKHEGPDLDGFGDKEIDQAGKDVDAIDFEDISDGDLASDDGSTNAAAPEISQVPGLTEDEGTSHDNDDINALFGEDDLDGSRLPSSPVAHVDLVKPQEIPAPAEAEKPLGERLDERNITDEEWNKMSFSERMRLNFPQTETADNAIGDWVMQTNTEDPSGLPPPQTEAELLAHKFPTFEKHKTLFHNQLFPQWPAEYMYKEPPTKDRDPPEFVPTKLELELDADTSKLFRIPDNALTATQQRSQQQGDDWGGTIGALAVEIDDGFSDDSDTDNELVGGFTLDEIATVCDDWDSLLKAPGASEPPASIAIADDEEMDDWDREFLQSQPQRKTPKYKPGLPDISSYSARGFGDFVASTRRFGKRVRLDLNDPYLLIDDTQSERPAKRPKLEEKTKRMANGQLGRDIRHHFNISNDEAYDQLKTNHKNKVRAVLSNRAVEHSMPALKLTFPFYRTKLSTQFWEHHRRRFDIDKLVRHAIGVRKPSKVKKKDWKGKSVAEVFKASKDLTLNDNSTVVLFEYCEQYPIMMSNFGMGSRVINYYRRKDHYEEEKPSKAEIGESHVLLPEDRSPFSIFGTVDPGETVPTLHNEMYRAPIFKHSPRPTDFLLGYTTNVTEGPKFYLRNIDHVYAVGQTFPSMEVPGPHARKVTNTAKNRLKMISYRMMRKKPTQDVSLAEITPHVFGQHDPQNRQKMKEFLHYDRERKTWVLPEGQTLMDENAIRSMIKPEDVCLIEAMQVGQELLNHAGYDPKPKNAKEAANDEDDDVGEEPLIARMAPWEITKNFIDASAGKAMVALHGEGDPTGHGLGFSFIKTSMKGGYINAVQGPLATSADAIERERKANGGHSYNVKRQQDMYNAAIRQIWERQKASLSDDTTHDDADVLDTANEDDRFNPRQSIATPAAHLDDGRSQLSRLSGTSRAGRKKLRITRKKRNPAGEVVTESVVLEDMVVIRSYMRQRKELEEKSRDVYSLQPSTDADDNREKQKLVERELSRLLKNQDRRQIREKQGKGKKKNANANPDASPDPSSADKASAGTTRKCANCGQVGHIKTNKSKCPLLNGTITANNNVADHGGFGSFSTPSAAAPAGE
ncbi:hypothetical protein DL766_000675 [Monosporascus sp. MC13-8B]|uniref:Transcription initiation factor TFIID subunit 1 histone acetyltransferase domain-containing protein n=1 Tax=Monosporascus cannonballus TaxID=155416 RepID=A0ABY0H5X8_9PEZI|nr:hypothetical protein DL762_006709 [Monosporascus cannonballus]RYO85684.1 hypothetical protein DL763_006987 [Monosporascus cannonballus]RYP39035.1 hypothetical protein DL766_000675 [Monosporascus sp. MC13-8B]